MRYLMFLFGIFCVLSSASGQAPSGTVSQKTSLAYYCPLHYHYTKPTAEICPHCGRTLMRVQTGLKGKIARIWLKFSLARPVQAAYHSLIFPAIIQGFILGLVLLFKARLTHTPRFFLALLLLSFSLFNVFFYGVEVGVLPRAIFPLLVPRFFVFAIGPLVWLYLKSLSVPAFKLSKKDLRHFLPIAFIVLPGLAVGPFSSDKVQRFLVENVQLAGMVFWLFYLPQSLRLARQPVLQKLVWAKTLAYGISLVWLGWVVFLLVDILVFDYRIANPSYYLVWLFISFFVYGIGITGFNQPHALTSPAITLLTQDGEVQQGIKKVLPTNLHPYLDKLTRLMQEQKPYLDPELTLESLAAMVEVHPKVLSQILNTGMEQSFYDFVNSCRIEEAKKMLSDTQYAHLSILGIALECGFNSKPTFNRAFKKFAHMSPSEFKNQQKVINPPQNSKKA